MLRPTDAARRYAFRHPIVRRTVYEGAGEARRLAAHARAAAALAQQPGAVAAQAHHLERSAIPGDAAAADVLEQAAYQAAARAPAVSARLLAAALRIRPEEDGDRRLGMLVAQAAALSATGRLDEALATLVESLARVPPERAEAARPARRRLRVVRERAGPARGGARPPVARTRRAARR